ncbi:hypothetical protein EI74_0300 [Mycoplasma testudineum]|uniref:Metallophosphoesterase n=1 Tax=Mycoplasma testudineum TaxID=244584 RepID=A0A4R6IEK6_9MOLU|nr:TIGR00282 family metallophosphoesterase [Mycoplasma testudineum]OYD26923.1 metallophosphatase [Mycoplasma testudineum]TDO20472.1 hypothetical protein EI74_0300 [Mycoplasma testudineum]
MTKNIRILFFGDIFGNPGINALENELPKLKKQYDIDFTIAQAENVSGRKGFVYSDYEKLKKIGIDAFTLGNHVWAKPGVKNIINNADVIRPLNINSHYDGAGVRFFEIKNKKIAIVSLMGIAFNKLNPPWEEEYANDFFDSIDKIVADKTIDHIFIDFHAETTSEKNVLALYLDGKVDAIVGTHTHVQTNDARILDNGTAFITDVGMVGPINSAIGANFEQVYNKMRFDKYEKFKVSTNPSQINGIIISLGKKNKIIKILNYLPEAK